MARDYDPPEDRDVEPAYEPYYLQDLLPWEREYELQHTFEPEEMERA